MVAWGAASPSSGPVLPPVAEPEELLRRRTTSPTTSGMEMVGPAAKDAPHFPQNLTQWAESRGGGAGCMADASQKGMVVWGANAAGGIVLGCTVPSIGPAPAAARGAAKGLALQSVSTKNKSRSGRWVQHMQKMGKNAAGDWCAGARDGRCLCRRVPANATDDTNRHGCRAWSGRGTRGRGVLTPTTSRRGPWGGRGSGTCLTSSHIVTHGSKLQPRGIPTRISPHRSACHTHN